MSIIEVKELTKTFNGDVTAVDHISFTVEEGEIFGFLGPNGAGKTTTLNMLATILRPTSGTAIVNGFDIHDNPDAVRRSIGFVFQDPTLDTELTGRENLDFHGRLYGLTKKEREERIKEILEVVQLTDRADAYVKTYSGGMKRRLEIARGLLHYPKVLFLDEPTLGLDPQTRRAIWDYIVKLNQEQNVTIILTTHYTEEADHLCNRIQIIDFGKIVANDTPENLKATLQGDVIGLTFKKSEDAQGMLSKLITLEWVKKAIPVTEGSNQVGMSNMSHLMRRIGQPDGVVTMGGIENLESGGKTQMARDPDEIAIVMSKMHEQVGLSKNFRQINLLVDNASKRIPGLVKIVDASGVELDSVQMNKPALDDVFLSVTGRSIRDEAGSMMQMFRQFRMMRQARGGSTPH
ncbi:MAG: ATP-binding cassette domain-containing protein [Promethearchaeota archaeon]